MIGFKIPRTKTIYPWKLFENSRWTHLKPSYRAFSNSIEGTLTMAVNGLGIAQVPTYLAQRYFESNKLVAVLPETRKESVNSFICLPRKEGRSKRVDSLVSSLTKLRDLNER